MIFLILFIFVAIVAIIISDDDDNNKGGKGSTSRHITIEDIIEYNIATKKGV